jgi:uncharacterized membrane protein
VEVVTMLMANMGHGYGFEHGGWGFLGWLLPLLFLGVLAGLGVWLVLRLTQRPAPAAAAGPGWVPPSAALEQVRSRYARGEIDREEFVQLSNDLGGAPVPPAAPPAAPTDPPPDPAA